jgi:lysophospholipid acyltransferase (LPLAT)-like uncharacterized protein
MRQPAAGDIGPPPASEQEERVRFAWAARLFGRLLARYLRLVAATSRVSGPPIVQEPCILVFWHESNLAAAIATLRMRDDHRFIAFSTRGFRGISMNTLLESLGGAVLTMPPLGSQSRAEAARLATEAGRLAREGWSIVVACDGPWGPYRVARPGALIVGREAGLPVVPWAVACRPAVRLRGRWDRQLLPLPFGRMRVDEGAWIRLGSREPIRPALTRLQAELLRVAELADRRMAASR